MSVAEREPEPGPDVTRVVDARWVRWSRGLLEVGDAQGGVRSLAVPARTLTFVGTFFAPLAEVGAGGRRLAVAARFPEGATVWIERRGKRTAVAASPSPKPGSLAGGAPAARRSG